MLSLLNVIKIIGIGVPSITQQVFLTMVIEDENIKLHVSA